MAIGLSAGPEKPPVLLAILKVRRSMSPPCPDGVDQRDHIRACINTAFAKSEILVTFGELCDKRERCCLSYCPDDCAWVVSVRNAIPFLDIGAGYVDFQSLPMPCFSSSRRLATSAYCSMVFPDVDKYGAISAEVGEVVGMRDAFVDSRVLESDRIQHSTIDFGGSGRWVSVGWEWRDSLTVTPPMLSRNQVLIFLRVAKCA